MSDFEPKEPVSEFGPYFSHEWEDYAKADLAGYREKLAEMQAEGFMTPEKVAASIENRIHEYESDDDFSRARKLLNNFWMWLPGGWYREITEEVIAHGDEDEDLAEKQRLMQSLDEALAASSDLKKVKRMVERIVKRDPTLDKTERMKFLVELFFQMRHLPLNQGFDRTLLRQ